MLEKVKNNVQEHGNFNTAPTGAVNMTKWITSGWDLVMSDFGQFLVLSFIYLVLLAVAFSTLIIGLILSGPLTVGFFYIIFNRIRGNPIKIDDIAKGFDFFLAAILADLLISAFTMIGFTFLIIPGIVISALYMFAFPLIIEKKMNFWEAMETSRKVVMKNIFELSIFMLILYVFLFMGMLLLLVGLIVAVPFVLAAIAFAYIDLIGLEQRAMPGEK
ncbi:MAG: hypothetical protein MUC94_02400 [bacterium]|nr:hypothetical protein [bacterium]